MPSHSILTSSTMSAALAAKKARGQEAPQRIIDCVEMATRYAVRRRAKRRTRAFMELMNGTQSAAMRHLFFAERAGGEDRRTAEGHAAAQTSNSVGIIGGGTMGGGIAMSFANAGIPVTLIEINDEALERGLSIIDRNYAGSVKRGKLSEDKAAALPGADPRLDRLPPWPMSTSSSRPYSRTRSSRRRSSRSSTSL